MCGPVALAAGAMAMTVAGQITQGVGAARQASYESQVAQINRKQASEQARDAITRGEEETRLFQQKAGQERGAMRAAMAANGIDVAYGSAADVLGDQAQMAAEDARAIASNSGREAQGFRQAAANWIGEGAAARARGRGGVIGAGFGATATALGGAQQIGKIQESRRRGGSGW